MFAPIIAFFAKPLIKKFLPYFLGALFLSIIIGWGVHKWHGYRDSLVEQGRQAGVAQMRDAYQKQVAANNQLNRFVEQRIQQGINDFSTKYEKDRQARILKEKASMGAIENKIAARPELYTNPACQIPPDMIAERNRIRALGPN